MKYQKNPKYLDAYKVIHIDPPDEDGTCEVQASDDGAGEGKTWRVSAESANGYGPGDMLVIFDQGGENQSIGFSVEDEFNSFYQVA